MTGALSRIDSYLASNQEKYLQEIVRLCAQPSISAKGEGVGECARLVHTLLEEHGLQVKSFETTGNPIIVGSSTGMSNRRLLFYNHYDVQPPEPLELWTSPPFEPTFRDGKLFARGVSDDKGELVGRLAALDAVRQAHAGVLPCGVVFVVEGEEEIGSPTVARFVREHLDLMQSDGAIWEGGGVNHQGHPGTTLGFRGILYTEFSVETLSRDAHSGNAHALPNAAWRLHRALASLKDENEHILIHGFYENAFPPSVSDLMLFDTLVDEEAIIRKNFGVKRFVNGLTGKELQKAVFNPTCNIDGITSGYQGVGMKTVIPGKAFAKVDFRLVPDQDPDDIFSKLRKHLDLQGFTDVEVKLVGEMWPFKTAAENPLVQLAARTAEQAYHKSFEIDPLGGGSSPAYAFAKPLGISVISPGIGYWDSRAHAPDENIRLEDFALGTCHLAYILDGFADL